MPQAKAVAKATAKYYRWGAGRWGSAKLTLLARTAGGLGREGSHRRRRHRRHRRHRRRRTDKSQTNSHLHSLLARRRCQSLCGSARPAMECSAARGSNLAHPCTCSTPPGLSPGKSRTESDLVLGLQAHATAQAQANEGRTSGRTLQEGRGCSEGGEGGRAG